jgi:hypothetical protein
MLLVPWRLFTAMAQQRPPSFLPPGALEIEPSRLSPVAFSRSKQQHQELLFHFSKQCTDIPIRSEPPDSCPRRRSLLFFEWL